MFLKHDGFRRLCHARQLLTRCTRPRCPSRTWRDRSTSRRFTSSGNSRRCSARRLTSFGSGRGSNAPSICWRSENSVTDVCLEVGFSSLGSFSDLFARRVGETPSAYGAGRGRWSRCPARCPRSDSRLPEPDGTCRRGVSQFSRSAGAAGVQTPRQNRSRREERMRIKLTSIMVDDQDKALGSTRTYWASEEARYSGRRVPMDHRRLAGGARRSRARARAERQSRRQGVSGSDVRAGHSARRVRGRGHRRGVRAV